MTSILNFLCKRQQALVFSILGAFITGWPLASARWYFTYLIGLILVWTLAPSAKKLQLYAYGALALGVIAKAYFLYLTPVIEMESIPIPMYKGQFIQSNPGISSKFEKLFLKHFGDDLDVYKKNPKVFGNHSHDFEKQIAEHQIALSKRNFEPILFDFKNLKNWLDYSKTWKIPVEVKNTLGEMPMALRLHIKSAHRGTMWPVGTIFEEKPDGLIITHEKIYNQGFTLKDHVGATFTIAYVKNVKDANGQYHTLNWVYLEVAEWSVYLPLILLIASLLLSDLTVFPGNAPKTIEHLTCLIIGFFTICVSDLDPTWNDCGFSKGMLHNLCNFIHCCKPGLLASESPVWYGLNVLLYPVTHFGYLLPILCFWGAAWSFLQLIRLFFTPHQAYIIWALLIATPWLARQGIGLHVYRPFYISYNSLMLGLPLFIIGLLGYFKKFTPLHGLIWIVASLCSPVISSGVIVLLIHKKIGKHRFWYCAIATILCFAPSKVGQYFLGKVHSLEKVPENPLNEWLLASLTKDPSLPNFEQILSFMRQSYKPFFILCVLIPNILLTRSKNALHKSIAWVALIMHGGFVLDGATVQDAYLACTLSALCATIYLFPYYERVLTNYRKLAAAS